MWRGRLQRKTPPDPGDMPSADVTVRDDRSCRGSRTDPAGADADHIRCRIDRAWLPGADAVARQDLIPEACSSPDGAFRCGSRREGQPARRILSPPEVSRSTVQKNAFCLNRMQIARAKDSEK